MSEASDIDTTVAPRASRMSAFCPPRAFGAADVLVVGVGAVGRQVALQLSAMGAGTLTVCDHDDISDVNTGPQMYPPDTVGQLKADVTAHDCRRLNPAVRVTAITRRLAKSDWRTLEDKVVVLTVDDIDTRKAIYEAAVRGKARAVFDARVQGENIRVIAQPAPAADSPYAATIFPKGEAVRGMCAGSRLSTYSAATAASLLSAKVAQYLRGSSEEFSDHLFGLSAWDLLETPRAVAAKEKR